MSHSPNSSPPDPRISALEAEVASLEAQLGGKDPEKIIQDHIDLLHRYNEVKDAAQSVIYQYSLIKRTTVAAVHEELGLPLKD